MAATIEPPVAEPLESIAATPDSRDPTLRSLLAPRTIAVIGASRRPETIGNQITRNLVTHGFTGAVYPVNPVARAVTGVRAYPRVADLPDRPDLAVIVVPAAQVIDVAEECGSAGVPSLCVISAGFKEIGPRGAELERQLVATVRGHGMRMIGPNCMGVLNAHPDVAMNATFAPAMPPFGSAAFVSQSGALGASVIDYAREYGIGLSQFVSVGNKPDISGNDLLLAWEHDPSVKVVLMYVENFGNPQRFLEIASRMTRTKPIIVVKSGRSQAGARAASSHTGALAASDRAVDALLTQAGVLRAASMEELFDMAMAFTTDAIPRSRRTAVLTNAGGPGILAADALEASGLELVDLAPETVARLAPLFPPEASIRNPLDMIASANPAGYHAALRAILDDPGIDAVVPIFVPPFGVKQEDVAEAIVAAARGSDKPLLAVLMGREGLPQGRAELNAAGIPAYIFPESAARALAALNRHREWAERPIRPRAPLAVDRAAAAAVIDGARRNGRSRLNEREALSLVEAYGIPVPRACVVTGAHAAADAAADIGFPVAMKVVSDDVLHKSDVGGVVLGVASARAASAAYDEIVRRVRTTVPEARIAGVLVERMVPEGRELIVGAVREPGFGAMVMFGLGGIFVETLGDVVFRVAPLDAREAEQMIDGVRASAIVKGVRGSPPLDRAAIADTIRRAAQLAHDFPEIAELDLNPVIAYEHGVVAADARVLLVRE